MRKDKNLEYVKKLRSGGVENKAMNYINDLRPVKPSAPSENIPEGWFLPTNQKTVGKKYAIIAVAIDGSDWSRALKGSAERNAENYDETTLLTDTNIFNKENKTLNTAAFLETFDDKYVFVCEESDNTSWNGYSHQFTNDSGYFGGSRDGLYLGGYDLFDTKFNEDNSLLMRGLQVGEKTGLIAPKSLSSGKITTVDDDSYTHKVYIYELPE